MEQRPLGESTATRCHLMFAGLFLIGMLLAPQTAGGPLQQARAAVAAAEAQHGADSLEAAEQLMKLYPLLTGPEATAESLQVLERIVAIRRDKLPPEHPRTGIALSNLGAARMQLGDLAAAQRDLAAAHAILAAGAPSRALLGALANLGACESRLGNYRRAAEHLEAAVACGAAHFADHPYHAMALQNLAQVRLNLGEIDTARRLVERTVALLARIEPGGARHAHALFGLGLTLLHAERLDEARRLFDEALVMRGRLHGVDSPEVGDIEAELGALARRRNDLDAARRHYARALALAAGARSPQWLAFRRAELARVLTAAGQLNDAAALVASIEAAGPVGQPELANAVRFARADLHAARLDWPAAIAEWRAVLVENRDDRLLSYRARSELALALVRHGDRAAAIPVLRENVVEFDGVLAAVLPALLEAERLRLVRTWRRDFDLLLACTAAAPSVDAAEVYRDVLAWKGQVARGVQRGLAAARLDPESAGRLRRLEQVTAEIAAGRGDAALAAERRHLLGATAMPAAARIPLVRELQAVLGDGELLIDYVLMFRDGQACYTAFVVRRDAVHRVELGPAEPIARAVESHVLLTSRSVRRGSGALAAPAAAAVRARVLDPLGALLNGCRKLWISPDAELGLLPFETLPGPGPGTYLVEDLEIGYLQSGAQLLATPAPLPHDPHLLLLGDIDFGQGRSPSATRRGVPRPFRPLPATAAEVAAIAALRGPVRCTTLSRAEATEAALRARAVEATWLHLATHGFCGHATGGDAIEAGIALAGANDAADTDDGILTIDEAALLDLRACRLVVLSACQTGLGEPFAGESLLGLRRSLHIAGAATSITSLWRIDDAVTAELMADLYRGLIGGGLSPAQALRAAQLQALERARRATGEGLPGHWGAFVCEGRG